MIRSSPIRLLLVACAIAAVPPGARAEPAPKELVSIAQPKIEMPQMDRAQFAHVLLIEQAPTLRFVVALDSLALHRSSFASIASMSALDRAALPSITLNDRAWRRMRINSVSHSLRSSSNYRSPESLHASTMTRARHRERR